MDDSWGGPPVRVTTDAEFYEKHSDSAELWSPGSPVFPIGQGDESKLPDANLRELLESRTPRG